MLRFSDLGHQSRLVRLLSVVNFIAPPVNGHLPDPFSFWSALVVILVCL
jgi:hypothetical protein